MADYVKISEQGGLEYAPVNFITPEGSTICNFNLDVDIMRRYGYKLLERGQREEGKDYIVTYEEQEDKIKEILEEIVPDPEEEARKERERLDNLKLTPSDVERALYYGLGMDFEDLKALISTQAPSVDIKAIGIEFRANDFYRGARDREGNRLVDMIGAFLGLASSELDYLFEHKELPLEAAERVRPILEALLHPIEEEPVVEEPIEEEPVVEEPTEEEPPVVEEPIEEELIEEE